MPIAVLSHPFCAGQVRIECTLCAIVFELWIDVQYNLRHLTPVGPLPIRLEHAQISNDMLLVVDREHSIRRCSIGNVWISGRFFHARVTKRMILDFCPATTIQRTYFSPFFEPVSRIR